MNLPKMVCVKQKFKTNSIKDIPAAVRSTLATIKPEKYVSSRESVAITAGSRGIADIVVILTELISELKKIGARPFIVPAMGSHGGAKAEGQRRIIEHYGITEEWVCLPCGMLAQ